MAYRGIFTPKNPKKYMGDPSNIIYRSTWERHVMNWLDINVNVLSWASEEIQIPYLSPVDSRWHRYFPDFLVKMKTKDGTIRVVMMEVKPKKQSRPPEQGKRVTKQYIQEVATWGVNQAKWKAAEEFCLDRGWEFKVITEDHLGL
jgi:hypothetical protein